jgi:hypothetical protein
MIQERFMQGLSGGISRSSSHIKESTYETNVE